MFFFDQVDFLFENRGGGKGRKSESMTGRGKGNHMQFFFVNFFFGGGLGTRMRAMTASNPPICPKWLTLSIVQHASPADIPVAGGRPNSAARDSSKLIGFQRFLESKLPKKGLISGTS